MLSKLCLLFSVASSWYAVAADCIFVCWESGFWDFLFAREVVETMGLMEWLYGIHWGRISLELVRWLVNINDLPWRAILIPATYPSPNVAFFVRWTQSTALQLKERSPLLITWSEEDKFLWIGVYVYAGCQVGELPLIQCPAVLESWDLEFGYFLVLCRVGIPMEFAHMFYVE